MNEIFVEVYEVLVKVFIRNVLKKTKKSRSALDKPSLALDPGRIISGFVVTDLYGNAYLKLESGFGFVPLVDKNYGICLRWIPYQEGKFVYRVRSPFSGLSLRFHPDYHAECKIIPEVSIPHGTLVVGNFRVRGQHGDIFIYCSFPNGASGWLFASRGSEQTLIPVSENYTKSSSLPMIRSRDASTHISTRTMFSDIEVYEVIQSVLIRKKLSINKESWNSTNTVLEKGRVVSGIVCEGNDHDEEYILGTDHNGTTKISFLKLENGQGYVSITGIHCEVYLRWIPLQEGKFVYRVQNPGHGLHLRYFPDFNPKFKIYPEVLFPHNSLVVCTAHVRGQFGDIFIRCENTEGQGGWLHTSKNRKQTLIPVSDDLNLMAEVTHEINQKINFSEYLKSNQRKENEHNGYNCNCPRCTLIRYNHRYQRSSQAQQSYYQPSYPSQQPSVSILQEPSYFFDSEVTEERYPTSTTDQDQSNLQYSNKPNHLYNSHSIDHSNGHSNGRISYFNQNSYDSKYHTRVVSSGQKPLTAARKTSSQTSASGSSAASVSVSSAASLDNMRRTFESPSYLLPPTSTSTSNNNNKIKDRSSNSSDSSDRISLPPTHLSAPIPTSPPPASATHPSLSSLPLSPAPPSNSMRGSKGGVLLRPGSRALKETTTVIQPAWEGTAAVDGNDETGLRVVSDEGMAGGDGFERSGIDESSHIGDVSKADDSTPVIEEAEEKVDYPYQADVSIIEDLS